MKLKSFGKAKETVNRTKQQLTEREMDFTNLTYGRELISKIYKEHRQTKKTRRNSPAVKNND